MDDCLKHLVWMRVQAEIQNLEAEDGARLIVRDNFVSEVDKLLASELLQILHQRNVEAINDDDPVVQSLLDQVQQYYERILNQELLNNDHLSLPNMFDPGLAEKLMTLIRLRLDEKDEEMAALNTDEPSLPIMMMMIMMMMMMVVLFNPGLSQQLYDYSFYDKFKTLVSIICSAIVAFLLNDIWFQENVEI
jgi:hypothetical protein